MHRNKESRFPSLGARWRRLRGLFPLRITGLLVLALSVLGFRYEGLDRSDLILLLSSLCLSALGILLMLTTAAGTLLTARRFRRLAPTDSATPLRLEVGARCITGMQVRSLWFPFLEVDWAWMAPLKARVDPRDQRGEMVEEVVPLRRALVDGLVREVQVRDVLGLTRLRWEAPWTRRLIIEPPRGRLDTTSLLHSLFAGEDLSDPLGDPVGDRVEMRQYSPGDPPRLILWKVYARTRKLMVRVPERAVSVQPRSCAYVVSGPGDDPVACLARTVLERELLGRGWRFGADGSEQPTSHLEEALLALARSGNPVAGTTGLGAFLRKAAEDGYRSCLVFVPNQPGAWLDEVARAATGSPLHLTFLAGNVHGDRFRRTLWQQWVHRPSGLEPSLLSPAVLDSLAAREHPVLSYDQEYGTIRWELASRT